MAKSKKARKASTRQVRPAPSSVATPQAPGVSQTYTASSRTAARTHVNLASEYHYVLADLRKIGIIAAAMFVLLFALAFIVR